MYKRPHLVKPLPILGHPGVRALERQVEVLDAPVALHQELVLGGEQAHVLLEHLAPDRVDEEPGDRGFREVAAEPANPRGSQSS